MIPGMNVLNAALRVIGQQTVQYYQFVDRSTNAIGLDEANYMPPIALSGSLQAVSREKIQFLGLDMQREYVNFFASFATIDISRDTSGDYFLFNGKKWQVLSITNWFPVDGWMQAMAVRVQDA